MDIIYAVKETDLNVYCGCSYNSPFDLGLQSYGQYFRLRNFKDNSEPYCRCIYDFDYTMPREIDHVDCANIGCSVTRNDGNMTWFVKRYNDTEIVLAGCGDDEYRYIKNDDKFERFV